MGKDELDTLEYSVDVLGEPEAIPSPAQLDVKKYGVIVSCGSRRETYTLERFEVVRHK